MIRKVKLDFRQLQISVLHPMPLQVLQPQDKLPHDDPRLFLSESTALLQEALEVEAVGVLMNHVDVIVRHERLEVLQAVVTPQLDVDLYLLACGEQVSLAALLDIVDLACIDLLGRVRIRLD